MKAKHLLERRATDHPPLSDIVSKDNLNDRLDTVNARIDGHWSLDDERWVAHKELHLELGRALIEYKSAANEWRALVSDRSAELVQLRADFLSRAEFQSEHRALRAEITSLINTLRGEVQALDGKVDLNTGDIKDARIESQGRRSVFSDTRSVVATLGIVAGVIVSALLILDRIHS